MMANEEYVVALGGLKVAVSQVCLPFTVEGSASWGQAASLLEQADTPPTSTPLTIERAHIVTLMRHLDHLSQLDVTEYRALAEAHASALAQVQRQMIATPIPPPYGPRRREVE